MTNSQPTQVLSAQQLRDAFGPLAADKQTRTPTVTKPEVIDLGSRVRDPQGIDMSKIGNTDDPTVTLFVTRQGSGKLDVIRKAVQDGHGAQVVQQELLQQGVLPERSVQEAVQEMINGPVYAEFRYADFNLAEHIFLPDQLNLMAYVFPYNGARLSSTGFSLTQWHKANTSADLEALVVHNAPPRTNAENAAAAGNPVIHPESVCNTTWWGVAGAAIAFTAGAAAAAGPSPEAFDVADLGDEVLRRLGDTPSVDDLINLRMFAALDE